MDKVIKDGTLRVLISESTCDVILSCKGHRLMAHKLILSIASPVFRELLRKNTTDSTTVLIIPDIDGSTMSTILDYIYSGTTVVYSDSLQEFLSVARFLQIAVETRRIGSILEGLQKVEDVKKLECSEKNYKEPNDRVENIEYCKIDVKKQDLNTKDTLEDPCVEEESNIPNTESKEFQIKTHKKLPDLLPISRGSLKKNSQHKMCKVVVPSPWCQRSNRSFLGDPRAVSVRTSERELRKLNIGDTNNNFQLSQNETPKCNPKSLDSIIRHLYLNNLDGGRERTSNNSITLGEDYSSKSSTAHCSENYQKDTSKTLEPCDSTASSFSRSLARFKRLEKDDCRLSSTKKDDISTIDSKKKRTLNGDFTLEPLLLRRDISSPLNFAQNLTLPRTPTSLRLTSPASLPPSTVLTSDSLTNSNIPLISPNNSQGPLKVNCKKSAKPVRTEPISISNDILNDGSNDDCFSNESSGDEKKDDAKKKSYKCDDCGKSFSQLRNYKYHRSVHEGTKEFSAKCPECGKMFNDRGYLSSHMKIHRDRKEYACPNCPKRFNQRVAYNMHLRIHTGVKPHECPTCGKSFSRKMLLKQHQRVHTGERPYTCPECGKTFADRSNMSLHARLHTGVKPYGCSLCPKSFTKKHHLKTHMNFHTGLKPYTCENCGLAFSQSSNMRTHYKKCILKDGIHKSTKSESVSSAENNSS